MHRRRMKKMKARPVQPQPLSEANFEEYSFHDQLDVIYLESQDELNGVDCSAEGRVSFTLALPGGQAEGDTPLPEAQFKEIEGYESRDSPPMPEAYIRWKDPTQQELEDEVEYEVDEMDMAWLTDVNEMRVKGELPPVSLDNLELLMDRLEKQSYLQTQSTGLDTRPVIDDEAVCCICLDGECLNVNAILFCDMCNLAVHQECYGVPYIPEGLWLCRHCLVSPSRALECILCPNKGGAFKQTPDGRWVHVVCALWIPEVYFSNEVYLEPVEGVEYIKPARMRLTCFVCKCKGKGACIQCIRPRCSKSFHVTCAQQAGLCMNMETVRSGSSVRIRKTAYCDNHAPADFIKNREKEPPGGQNLRQTRKLLADKRGAVPTVSIPTIEPDRLAHISAALTFEGKEEFIRKVVSYWKLRRIERNGVPLLRRLQVATPSSSRPLAPPPVALSRDDLQTNAVDIKPRVEVKAEIPVGGTAGRRSKILKSQFKIKKELEDDKAESGVSWGEGLRALWKQRQDMERARLLCEMMLKREKLKKELVFSREDQLALEIRPLSVFLLRVLDQLVAKDAGKIFALPVDPLDAPDYHSIVANPMDFFTMRTKIQDFLYYNLKEMELDFKLMIDNCFLYNHRGTKYYRAAERMAESGEVIFRNAETMAAAVGFDYENGGLHQGPDALMSTQVENEIELVLSDPSRHALPGPQHMAVLEELLEKSILIQNHSARKLRFSQVRSELARLGESISERAKDSGNNEAIPPTPGSSSMKKRSSTIITVRVSEPAMTRSRALKNPVENGTPHPPNEQMNERLSHGIPNEGPSTRSKMNKNATGPTGINGSGSEDMDLTGPPAPSDQVGFRTSRRIRIAVRSRHLRPRR